MKPAINQNSSKDILRKYFGYDSFREHQEEIIRQLISGTDVFVLMPTGGGKSLCYQIPAILRQGVGIVISPLIALMQDQVDALRQMGIRSDFLNSSLSFEEARKVEQRVISGETELLYVAPERLMTPMFQHLLNQIPHLSLFAIDEAHCVSQWGHDFRPEYLQIASLLEQFPHVPRMALTATADAVTRKEILAKLKLRNVREYVSSFDRPNICYRVGLKQNEKKQLSDFLQTAHPKDSGIVYCLTRKKVDNTAKWLSTIGYTALPYHAGMDQNSRKEHQRRFLREERVIIVATIAFGMGIDKPDVRFVAHLDMPKSIEAYYQETGRAGRDGESSDAWMIYSLGDVVRLRKLAENSGGDAQFQRIQDKKREAMLGYCETTQCRRQVLLAYFGEELPEPCGNCDTCMESVETWDGTVAAQKALSCVYRTGQRFGANYLGDVLLGKSTERICKFRHDKISTFGIGKDFSKKEWESVFRQLVAAGLLSVDMEGGGFFLPPKSRPVLRGEQKVFFRKDPAPDRLVQVSDLNRPLAHEFKDPVFKELWEKLRALRLKIAREKNIPPYVIFHDVTLKEMIQTLPRSLDEMGGIHGIGVQKLEFYGKQFLEVIEDHIQEHGITGDFSERNKTDDKAERTSDEEFSAYFSPTVSETLYFFKEGKTPEQIAEIRGFVVGTIYSHLEKAIEANYLSVDEIISLKKEEVLEIENAFRELPEDQKHMVKPIFEKFEEKYDYGILRCIRAGMIAAP